MCSDKFLLLPNTFNIGVQGLLFLFITNEKANNTHSQPIMGKKAHRMYVISPKSLQRPEFESRYFLDLWVFNKGQ